MKVLIPGALRAYTGGQGEVEARGASLDEVLADLDRRYPDTLSHDRQTASVAICALFLSSMAAK